MSRSPTAALPRNVDRKYRLHEAVRWLLLCAVMTLALLGLFGEGWLGDVTRQSADGTLSVHYDYFQRFDTPLCVELKTASLPDSQEITVVVDDAWLRHFQLDQFTPEPVRTVAAEHETHFVFRVDSAVKPQMLRTYWRPEVIGRVGGSMSLLGRDPVSVSALVYP